MRSFVFSLAVASFFALPPVALGQTGGDGSLEGPVEGPIEGPVEGPIEGPVEGPMEGPVEGAAPSGPGQGAQQDLGDALEAGDTGLTGTVVDASSQGMPMAGVKVRVVEADRTVWTTEEGRFQLRLEPGQYTVRVHTDFYAPVRLENVEVVSGEIARVGEVALSLDDDSIGDAVVTTYRIDKKSEAAQLQIRKRSAAVRDSVSQEEINRTGDSSASAAARRVVATTIVGGRYLYVRGLGGRYTNVLLNGALLPRLDPDAPGVQLDLFPSSTLSSIAVVKSYTPDLPGAFGGGTMILETRQFPEETFQAGASIGFGANSETTWHEAPVHSGGRFDLLGFDDGTRKGALPDAIRDVRFDNENFPDSERRAELMGQFRDNWSIRQQRQSFMPPSSLGLHAGGTVDLGSGNDFGYHLRTGWSMTRQRLDEVLDVPKVEPGGDDGSDVSLTRKERQLRESFQTSARLYALGTAGVDLGDDHTLSYVSLFNQSASDYTGLSYGTIEELDSQEQALRGRMRFVQRTMWFNQVRGQHFFGDASLDWRLNTTEARRLEPDTRDFRYNGDNDPVDWPENPWGRRDAGFVWAPQQPIDGQRLFLELDQRDWGGGAKLSWDYKQAGLVKPQIGASFRRSESDFSVRRFQYRRPSRPDPDAAVDVPPDQLFAAGNARRAWTLSEITRRDDGYAAQEDLYAAFASVEAHPIDRLRLFAGVRAEAFRQRLTPQSPFAEEPLQGEALTEAQVYRTTIDYLPAVSAAVEVHEDMFVRAAYSVTVARPRARELSGAVLPDFVRNRTIFGDPSVTRTRIQNIDVRWEWFPSTDEVLAVSGFAKLFEDPIEYVIFDANRTVSFQNIDGARNLGAEAELRVGLDRLHDSLSGFQLGSNLTLVLSEAQLSEDQLGEATNQNRPLAGQSPWVSNLSLGYAPEGSAFSAFLFYNVFGARIEEVGTRGLPDSYRQPFHSLDLTGQWQVDEHIRLKLVLRNLAHDRVEVRQGGFLIRGYQPGVSGSLGVSFTN